MSSAKKCGPVQPSTSTWRPLGADEIQITGGIWGQKQRLNRDTILEHCESWMERIGWIGNFDRAAAGTTSAGHCGIEFDSEVYKLLEAMAWEIGREHSGSLAHRYQGLVERVAAAQEPDGYLHTSFGRPGQPPRYFNLEFGHELLRAPLPGRGRPAAPVMTTFSRRSRAAWRTMSTISSDRGAESPCAGILRSRWPWWNCHGRPENSATSRSPGCSSSAGGTGTLGAHPFGQEYFQDDISVRQATTVRGHAVRALYLAAGALDVATETGDAALAAAIREQWANGVAHRTYITGGLGSHHRNEASGVDFELAADRAYAETCAGIASVMLSWRLLLATGEDKYADMIERTLLNNVLADVAE